MGSSPAAPVTTERGLAVVVAGTGAVDGDGVTQSPSYGVKVPKSTRTSRERSPGNARKSSRWAGFAQPCFDLRGPARSHQRVEDLPRARVGGFETRLARGDEPLEQIAWCVEVPLRGELAECDPPLDEAVADGIELAARAPRDVDEETRRRSREADQIYASVGGRTEHDRCVTQSGPRLADPRSRQPGAVASHDD